MKNLANKYRLPETTTQEQLEECWSTVINFGNKVLLAGYYYNGKYENSYFAAVYEHTSEDLSIEGEIKLAAISEEFFEDNGHALACQCVQVMHKGCQHVPGIYFADRNDSICIVILYHIHLANVYIFNMY